LDAPDVVEANFNSWLIDNMNAGISGRERSEVERSAAEARSVVLRTSDIDRYLNPRSDTPFPLEYAFYLLGNVEDKTVLDLGCGTGENIPPLIARGANVIGIDISPDLIALAEQRLMNEQMKATVRVGSAYDTELPDESVDVIFCMSLVHHLEISRVQQEMNRILRKGGFVILREPIRFSSANGRLRKLLPAHDDISDCEHPLTRGELALMTEGFEVTGTRFFRLPFVPLLSRYFASRSNLSWRASNWMLRSIPAMNVYASLVAMKPKK
jgi:SAM-dependent methyltransferase